MMEADLVQYLLDGPGMAMLGDRLYPQRLPQNTALPAGTYQRISAVRPIQHDGATGLVACRIQISLYGERYGDIKTLADLVRARLHGYAGYWPATWVQLATLLDEQDGYEEAIEIQRIIQDYQIFYKE